MNTIDIKALPAHAWRPIETDMGRTANRVSERELERIPAWIILQNNPHPTSNATSHAPGTSASKEIRVKLWDYSSFGFAVVCNHANAELLSIEERDRVVLKIDFGDGPLLADCVVRNHCAFRNGLRIGLSRRDLTRKGSDQ